MGKVKCIIISFSVAASIDASKAKTIASKLLSQITFYEVKTENTSLDNFLHHWNHAELRNTASIAR